MSASAAVAALSIMFEVQSRRQEIGYFVLAKALGSGYKGLKRRRWVSLGRELMVMQVGMMTVIYYLYCHHPDMLKFRNIF